jgi:hypothetical protein
MQDLQEEKFGLFKVAGMTVELSEVVEVYNVVRVSFAKGFTQDVAGVFEERFGDLVLAHFTVDYGEVTEAPTIVCAMRSTYLQP